MEEKTDNLILKDVDIFIKAQDDLEKALNKIIS